MGKNPADAKKKGGIPSKPKTCLYVTSYVKKNGNIGLRSQFKKVEGEDDKREDS